MTTLSTAGSTVPAPASPAAAPTPTPTPSSPTRSGSSGWCGSATHPLRPDPDPGSWSGLIQPVLFLFVLGYGMSRPGRHGPEDFKFRHSSTRGCGHEVVMTSHGSRASIVWDRESASCADAGSPGQAGSPSCSADCLEGRRFAGPQERLCGAAPLVGIHLTTAVVVQMIALELLMA